MREHCSPFLDPGPPMDALAEERIRMIEELRQIEIERQADEIASDIQGGRIEEHMDELVVRLLDIDEADIIEALYEVAEKGNKRKAREVWQVLVEETSQRVAERRVDDE
jgi:hypothetical protein